MSAVVPLVFDWKNPDYVQIFRQRIARLEKLRRDPELLLNVRAYYRDGHIDDFINDWGVTFDTRVAALGRSPVMPMLLFPKQREFIQFLYARWRNSEPGVAVKSRDVGVSWLVMGFSAAMAIFYDDISIGVGSEKEDKIDRSGDPDCLFWKGRQFLHYLPMEFKSGWHDHTSCTAHMRLIFPDTGSSVTGEAGKNIGRGGRKAIYFVDESAHVPNPRAMDSSLSATTDCRVDVSSVFGMANSFAERAHNPSIPRFDFDWHDDPRKDATWEAKKRAELDPIVFEAEYGRNFNASVEGVVIPHAHVVAAIDAHKILGIPEPTGRISAAMDVADSGADANAWGGMREWLLLHAESWKGSPDLDIFHSVERSFFLCDSYGADGFLYDADGLGAGVRGDARKVNERRKEQEIRTLNVAPFRGSGGVHDPERIVDGTERKAEDFFENFKAQSWWFTKWRFQHTYRVIQAYLAGEDWRSILDMRKFISISKDFAERAKLCSELSQPIWTLSKHGKVMVDKCPPGTDLKTRASIKSPNLGDVVMMLCAPKRESLKIHPSLLQQTTQRAFR